jgi:hypothetical protein
MVQAHAARQPSSGNGTASLLRYRLNGRTFWSLAGPLVAMGEAASHRAAAARGNLRDGRR